MRPNRATLARWVSHHAWSRAGAIAELLATRTTRRVIDLTTALALLVGGAATIAAGVAVLLWTELGPGPLDVFISAIHVRFGIPLSAAVWIASSILIAVAVVLGRRPGPGTIAAPVFVGAFLDGWVALLGQIGRPDQVAVLVVAHLAAVLVVGVGAGMLVVSGLGAGTGELVAAAASDRTGRPEPGVRLLIEVTWVAVGLALGGRVGIGTALVMLAIGPAVAVGYRAVDRFVASSRHAAGRARRQVAVLSAARA